MTTFLVLVRRSGPQWNPSRRLNEQPDWSAHAAFMNGLVDDGFILLGGPLADEHRVAHVVEAESEDAVRSRFAEDPWSGTHVVVDTVERWTLLLDSRSP